ncbi:MULTISPECIES: type II toxin-antitoxin system RelE/ParE family toxin [Actinomycetaceae]|uniref:Type II toxin-antitoxin system RelE/ParE family toxin n=2 Tax=Actinomycetaceae TaxID=2049 RepID=A0ABZ0RAH4_9ACTO|nr:MULTISPECIES: type II toxin-antitoxin system RelE/ParE family toxin [Actinotignum]WPJ89046.1 type II toxin-antitoxin system RelE/ParE family toxin [Schaalia turicensis]MDE1553462.1 type II toxin-antitoxin system RelE/ParE family toxin [Actinotignum sanguinis]MDE1566237.1 type II toxin-antitoxin system RelE/ParE family toxin [Actinotignum sanguinis]MDE1577966.1 type II toxin-antitoxin system RelE/ParE family toxin [Actinotignum sanguinis]MDE1642725.1 type II toxin-antitoxin system RelE/ParE 
MSYAVVISREAKEDLRSIYAYIAFNLRSPRIRSPQTAQRPISRIKMATKGLNNFPKRHRLANFEPYRSRGLRINSCDNYLIFYFTQESVKEVLISRVLCAKRNIESALAN